jgi:FdhD protein
MESETNRIPILRFGEEGKSSIKDIVVREFPLTIVLNGQELVTLLCSPTNLEYLAAGFLLSEGLIKGKDDIKAILVDEQKGVARVETKKAVDVSLRRVLASGGGKGIASSSAQKVSVEPQTKFSASRVFSLMHDLVQRSRVFKATGGVHSAALCNTEGILVFSEDIGRHNAIDKILGECLLKGITTDNRLVITSGRVSSEILLKVARRNVPILISKSAPTDLGVKLADDLGVTLVGFARGKRMNVYTNGWRVTE